MNKMVNYYLKEVTKREKDLYNLNKMMYNEIYENLDDKLDILGANIKRVGE